MHARDPLRLPSAVLWLVAGCGGGGSGFGGDAGGDGGPSTLGGSDAAGTSSAVVAPPVGTWVRSIEGVGDEGVTTIAAGADGSLLVLGTYEGPGTLNPGRPDELVLALPDGAREDVLVRYAPDGSLQSARADPLGTGGGHAHLAADGGLYVTGSGAFAAGGATVPSDTDVFVARYAPEGMPLWARGASGAAGTGAGTVLATSGDGSVVVGGTFEGTITFGIGEATETRLASTSEEIFLARYDAAGALLWARRTIAAPYLPEWKLAVAQDGGIFVYGTLENVTTFNPGLGDETLLRGGNVGFVARLDADGAVRWARALDQAEGSNRVEGLAIHLDGSVVVTGSFDRMLTLGLGEPAQTTLAAVGSDFPGRTQFQDFFAARFGPNGELVWARREGGEVWDAGYQAHTLDDGATLVAGDYTNTVTFAAGESGQTTLSTPANERTAFLAVFDRDGSLRWVRQGLTGQVAPLADGSVGVAGTFMGTRTLFPGELGETTLASAGRWDVYVARFAW